MWPGLEFEKDRGDSPNLVAFALPALSAPFHHPPSRTELHVALEPCEISPHARPLPCDHLSNGRQKGRKRQQRLGMIRFFFCC